MSRFDCPSCAKSLRWRLLRHVPQSDGQLAFSCAHCAAVLAYSGDELPLGRLFWGTRVRSLFTFVGGIALFSAIDLAAGHAAALAAIGMVAVLLFAGYSFSPRPAYKLLSERKERTA
jgi:hypothetical protein